MIERNRANCIVEIQIILKGGIVAFPPHYIIGTELGFTLIDLANVFVVNLHIQKHTFHSYFLS